MAGTDGPFSASAFPDNRSGRPTDEQLRLWTNFARERRNGIRRAAWPVAAIGAVLLLANGPPSKATMRNATGAGCLALAVAIVLLAGKGAMADDLREGRFDVVEGAIGKHLVQTPRSRNTSFYLDIAGRHLKTGRTSYEAAPEAGIVRAFYWPRSRRLVNLEQLPDRSLPAGPGGMKELALDFVHALRGHDQVALAEARATAEAIKHAVEGPPPASALSAIEGDSRPLAEAICGTWVNPLATVIFAADGTAALTTLGGQRRTGHWSVDANGRLLTDATGKMEPADARVTGEFLTIALDGRTVRFSRAN